MSCRAAHDATAGSCRWMSPWCGSRTAQPSGSRTTGVRIRNCSSCRTRSWPSSAPPSRRSDWQRRRARRKTVRRVATSPPTRPCCAAKPDSPATMAPASARRWPPTNARSRSIRAMRRRMRAWPWHASRWSRASRPRPATSASRARRRGAKPPPHCDWRRTVPRRTRPTPPGWAASPWTRPAPCAKPGVHWNPVRATANCCTRSKQTADSTLTNGQN